MSARGRPKSLAEQLEELDKPSKDFDPEALSEHGEESELGSDEADREIAGREHYEIVGRSKLRKQDITPLGPQYQGSRITRNAAFEEDSDDPFSRGFEQDNSEDSSGEQLNGHTNGRLEADEDEDEELDEGEDEFESQGFGDELIDGQDSDDTSDTDMNGEDYGSDDEEDNDSVSGLHEQSDLDRSALRKLMTEQQNSAAASLSQAAKVDAEKGEAVKKQRKVFDFLLNTRIRLQKALQSANTLASIDPTETKYPVIDPAIVSAEAAALKLWNTLNDLRESLESRRAGTKRKRDDHNAHSSSKTLWSCMEKSESISLPHRQAILEKWSARARNAVVMPSTRRLNATAEQTIVEILNNHLSDTDRLTKRTRVPRSCAPAQAARGLAESDNIYDDADFYGPLLKDFLEQRSDDNVNGLGQLTFQSVAPWQAVREAKAKKTVDTRASKGRKMRFTVQEQIQNFMAAEDRGTWGDRQREELFASLFGRRQALEENAEAQSDSEVEMTDGDGFVLFRS